jgi:hypothetical protein
MSDRSTGRAAQSRVATHRRRLLLGLVLAALAGCGTPAQPHHFDSQISYDRTFDIALAAMADQKMIFSAQDRRQGLVVAERNGDTIRATVQPQYDGTNRVTFSTPGDKPADAELLKRVIDAYNNRMAKLSLLGGFKDSSGASQQGPIPCPGGPAFCP